MTFSHEDQSPRIETRVSPEFKSRLDEFCDKHDLTRSEVIRESLQGHLPDDGEGPSDPDLRETWNWLRMRADNRGKVPSKDAIADLAQQKSMDKKYIKHAKLEPLRREGWITPNHTTIIVHEPSDE